MSSQYGQLNLMHSKSSAVKSFPLTAGANKIGSNDEMDIRIHRDGILPLHFIVDVNENNMAILTATSNLNVTYLNDKPLVKGKGKLLEPSDVICFSDLKMVYENDTLHDQDILQFKRTMNTKTFPTPNRNMLTHRSNFRRSFKTKKAQPWKWDVLDTVILPSSPLAQELKEIKESNQHATDEELENLCSKNTASRIIRTPKSVPSKKSTGKSTDAQVLQNELSKSVENLIKIASKNTEENFVVQRESSPIGFDESLKCSDEDITKSPNTYSDVDDEAFRTPKPPPFFAPLVRSSLKKSGRTTTHSKYDTPNSSNLLMDQTASTSKISATLESKSPFTISNSTSKLLRNSTGQLLRKSNDVEATLSLSFNIVNRRDDVLKRPQRSSKSKSIHLDTLININRESETVKDGLISTRSRSLKIPYLRNSSTPKTDKAEHMFAPKETPIACEESFLSVTSKSIPRIQKSKENLSETTFYEDTKMSPSIISDSFVYKSSADFSQKKTGNGNISGINVLENSVETLSSSLEANENDTDDKDFWRPINCSTTGADDSENIECQTESRNRRNFSRRSNSLANVAESDNETDMSNKLSNTFPQKSSRSKSINSSMAQNSSLTNRKVSQTGNSTSTPRDEKQWKTPKQSNHKTPIAESSLKVISSSSKRSRKSSLRNISLKDVSSTYKNEDNFSNTPHISIKDGSKKETPKIHTRGQKNLINLNSPKNENSKISTENESSDFVKSTTYKNEHSENDEKISKDTSIAQETNEDGLVQYLATPLHENSAIKEITQSPDRGNLQHCSEKENDIMVESVTKGAKSANTSNAIFEVPKTPGSIQKLRRSARISSSESQRRSSVQVLTDITENTNVNLDNPRSSWSSNGKTLFETLNKITKSNLTTSEIKDLFATSKEEKSIASNISQSRNSEINNLSAHRDVTGFDTSDDNLINEPDIQRSQKSAGTRNGKRSSKKQRSPLNDLRDVQGVKKLLKTPKVQKPPRNDLTNVGGVKQLFSSPKLIRSPKNDLLNVEGVKGLLRTPKAQIEPLNDLRNIPSIKTLFALRKEQHLPLNDLRDVIGVKKLLKTPKLQKEPRNDLRDIVGIKRLFTTPKEQSSPNNDLRDVRGVKKIFKTPKVQNEPINDLTNVAGVRNLYFSKKQRSPKNDLTEVQGVRRLMKTPTSFKSPSNDLTDVTGVKKLFKSAKKVTDPYNDLSDVRGVRNLLSTPYNAKSPKNDLRDVGGVRKLFTFSRKEVSPTNDLADVRGVRNLMKTPKQKNVLDATLLTNLMATPNATIQKQEKRKRKSQLRRNAKKIKSSDVHEGDYTDVVGIKRMFAEEEANYRREMNVSGVTFLFQDDFDKLIGKEPVRQYPGKSSPAKQNSFIKPLHVLDYSLTNNSHVEEWIKEQSKVIPTTSTPNNRNNQLFVPNLSFTTTQTDDSLLSKEELSKGTKLRSKRILRSKVNKNAVTEDKKVGRNTSTSINKKKKGKLDVNSSIQTDQSIEDEERKKLAKPRRKRANDDAELSQQQALNLNKPSTRSRKGTTAHSNEKSDIKPRTTRRRKVNDVDDKSELVEVKSSSRDLSVSTVDTEIRERVSSDVVEEKMQIKEDPQKSNGRALRRKIAKEDSNSSSRRQEQSSDVSRKTTRGQLIEVHDLTIDSTSTEVSEPRTKSTRGRKKQDKKQNNSIIVISSDTDVIENEKPANAKRSLRSKSKKQPTDAKITNAKKNQLTHQSEENESIESKIKRTRRAVQKTVQATELEETNNSSDVIEDENKRKGRQKAAAEKERTKRSKNNNIEDLTSKQKKIEPEFENESKEIKTRGRTLRKQTVIDDAPLETAKSTKSRRKKLETSTSESTSEENDKKVTFKLNTSPQLRATRKRGLKELEVQEEVVNKKQKSTARANKNSKTTKENADSERSPKKTRRRADEQLINVVEVVQLRKSNRRK